MPSTLQLGQIVWAAVADARGYRKLRPAVIVAPSDRIRAGKGALRRHPVEDALDPPIGKIARTVGFSRLESLSRAFSKRYGVRPTIYREFSGRLSPEVASDAAVLWATSVRCSQG